MNIQWLPVACRRMSYPSSSGDRLFSAASSGLTIEFFLPSPLRKLGRGRRYYEGKDLSQTYCSKKKKMEVSGEDPLCFVEDEREGEKEKAHSFLADF